MPPHPSHPYHAPDGCCLCMKPVDACRWGAAGGGKGPRGLPPGNGCLTCRTCLLASRS